MNARPPFSGAVLRCGLVPAIHNLYNTIASSLRRRKTKCAGKELHSGLAPLAKWRHRLSPSKAAKEIFNASSRHTPRKPAWWASKERF
jgi:hypothetical protein